MSSSFLSRRGILTEQNFRERSQISGCLGLGVGEAVDKRRAWGIFTVLEIESIS